MIHCAFTVTEQRASIIIKDSALHIIHTETILLGPETPGKVGEWFACRAALRVAGKLGPNQALRLYSDSDVLADLALFPTLSEQLEIKEVVKVPHGYGRNPALPQDGRNRERVLYYDTIGLLIALFSEWNVYIIEKERIT